MIEGQPTWTGEGREAVLSWIHTPRDGTSRGIVLLAPPAGREQALSMLTVRRLAVLLAQRGYTAVRFFWRGTADSQPLYGDADVIARWQEDVRGVLRQARELLSDEHLPAHAVGYRVGASVVASMAHEFSTVIAWEPISGGSMVRQWGRLRQTVAGHIRGDDREVDLMGLLLSADQAASLSSLAAPPTGVGTEVKEMDRRRAKAMYSADPFELRIHDDVLQQIIAALPGGRLRPVAARLALRRENRWCSENGRWIRERLVEIGPEARTGIVTWAEDDQAAGASDLPDLSADPEPHDRDLQWSRRGLIVSGGGPDGRAGNGEWPYLSRSLAEDGVVTLRSDRPLTADATPLEATRATNSYTLRSSAGIQDMVDWLRTRGCATVIGCLHCASAWAACLGELHGAPIRTDAMVLVNHSEWKMSQELWAAVRETYDADAVRPVAEVRRASGRGEHGSDEDRAGLGSADRLSRSVRETAARLRAIDPEELKSGARHRIVHALRHRLPYPAWRWVAQRGWLPAAEAVLEPMAQRQPLLILNGPDDIARWETTRADRAVRRLAEQGLRIREQRCSDLDHSLLTSTAQRALLSTMRRELRLDELDGSLVAAS